MTKEVKVAVIAAVATILAAVVALVGVLLQPSDSSKKKVDSKIEVHQVGLGVGGTQIGVIQGDANFDAEGESASDLGGHEGVVAE